MRNPDTTPDSRQMMGGDPGSGIPRTIEDEQRIIGDMLRDPNFARDAADGLRPTDFRDERHQEIFRAIVLGVPDNSTDCRSVWQRLKLFGRLKAAGGKAYVNELRWTRPESDGGTGGGLDAAR